MIKWNENIIIHNSIDNIEDVKTKIENREKPLGLYCIINSLTKDNLCEIVSVIELSNVFYDKYFQHSGGENDIMIYGIAKGRRNIREVLLELVIKLIDKDGVIDKQSLTMLGGD